jgi:hypothetical protein
VTERGSALVTLLFTDLVGSTELLARAGDEQARHQLLADTVPAQSWASVWAERPWIPSAALGQPGGQVMRRPPRT